MNLEAHIRRQQIWSENVFGPGDRLEGVLKHITKEVQEVRDGEGNDLFEWIDVIILAIDGAWRSGFEAHEIARALTLKQEVNELRRWPNWRERPLDESIEHKRAGR